jgi:hypothetical protein
VFAKGIAAKKSEDYGGINISQFSALRSLTHSLTHSFIHSVCVKDLCEILWILLIDGSVQKNGRKGNYCSMIWKINML